MKTWYLTREPNLVHKGSVVPTGAKIYLTPDQAKLHQAKIVKTEPPDNQEKSFVLSDYSEYLGSKIQESEQEVTASKNKQKNKRISDDDDESEDKTPGVSPGRGV